MTNNQDWSSIEIFLLAQTKLNSEEVSRWLNYLGTSSESVCQTEDVSDPALLVALAAKRCYLSFEPGLNPNVTKVRRDWMEYLDNILKSGHGSVLEHSTYTFAIEGVSRVFTAEMNRHRAGWAVSEGSLRYIRPHDFKMWFPASLAINEKDTDDVKLKKQKTIELFHKAMNQDKENYKDLEAIWQIDAISDFSTKKKLTSLFRRILPLGIATGGVWTGNFRALRHVIAMRASPEAEEEICFVFCKIAKMMVEREPLLFGDFLETPDGFWYPKYKKV
jgi:thymidylate synthase (FAD)